MEKDQLNHYGIDENKTTSNKNVPVSGQADRIDVQNKPKLTASSSLGVNKTNEFRNNDTKIKNTYILMSTTLFPSNIKAPESFDEKPITIANNKAVDTISTSENTNKLSNLVLTEDQVNIKSTQNDTITQHAILEDERLPGKNVETSSMSIGIEYSSIVNKLNMSPSQFTENPKMSADRSNIPVQTFSSSDFDVNQTATAHANKIDIDDSSFDKSNINANNSPIILASLTNESISENSLINKITYANITSDANLPITPTIISESTTINQTSNADHIFNNLNIDIYGSTATQNTSTESSAIGQTTFAHISITNQTTQNYSIIIDHVISLSNSNSGPFASTNNKTSEFNSNNASTSNQSMDSNPSTDIYSTITNSNSELTSITSSEIGNILSDDIIDSDQFTNQDYFTNIYSQTISTDDNSSYNSQKNVTDHFTTTEVLMYSPAIAVNSSVNSQTINMTNNYIQSTVHAPNEYLSSISNSFHTRTNSTSNLIVSTTVSNKNFNLKPNIVGNGTIDELTESSDMTSTVQTIKADNSFVGQNMINVIPMVNQTIIKSISSIGETINTDTFLNQTISVGDYTTATDIPHDSHSQNANTLYVSYNIATDTSYVGHTTREDTSDAYTITTETPYDNYYKSVDTSYDDHYKSVETSDVDHNITTDALHDNQTKKADILYVAYTAHPNTPSDGHSKSTDTSYDGHTIGTSISNIDPTTSPHTSYASHIITTETSYAGHTLSTDTSFDDHTSITSKSHVVQNMITDISPTHHIIRSFSDNLSINPTMDTDRSFTIHNNDDNVSSIIPLTNTTRASVAQTVSRNNNKDIIPIAGQMINIDHIFVNQTTITNISSGSKKLNTNALFSDITTDTSFTDFTTDTTTTVQTMVSDAVSIANTMNTDISLVDQTAITDTLSVHQTTSSNTSSVSQALNTNPSFIDLTEDTTSISQTMIKDTTSIEHTLTEYSFTDHAINRENTSFDQTRATGRLTLAVSLGMNAETLYTHPTTSISSIDTGASIDETIDGSFVNKSINSAVTSVIHSLNANTSPVVQNADESISESSFDIDQTMVTNTTFMDEVIITDASIGKFSDVSSVDQAATAFTSLTSETVNPDLLLVTETTNTNASTVNQTLTNGTSFVNHTISTDTSLVDLAMSPDTPIKDLTKNTDGISTVQTINDNGSSINHSLNSNIPSVFLTNNQNLNSDTIPIDRNLVTESSTFNQVTSIYVSASSQYVTADSSIISQTMNTSSSSTSQATHTKSPDNGHFDSLTNRVYSPSIQMTNSTSYETSNQNNLNIGQINQTGPSKISRIDKLNVKSIYNESAINHINDTAIANVSANDQTNSTYTSIITPITVKLDVITISTSKNELAKVQSKIAPNKEKSLQTYKNDRKSAYDKVNNNNEEIKNKKTDKLEYTAATKVNDNNSEMNGVLSNNKTISTHTQENEFIQLAPQTFRKAKKEIFLNDTKVNDRAYANGIELKEEPLLFSNTNLDDSNEANLNKQIVNSTSTLPTPLDVINEISRPSTTSNLFLRIASTFTPMFPELTKPDGSVSKNIMENIPTVRHLTTDKIDMYPSYCSEDYVKNINGVYYSTLGYIKSEFMWQRSYTDSCQYCRNICMDLIHVTDDEIEVILKIKSRMMHQQGNYLEFWILNSQMDNNFCTVNENNVCPTLRYENEEGKIIGQNCSSHNHFICQYKSRIPKNIKCPAIKNQEWQPKITGVHKVSFGFVAFVMDYVNHWDAYNICQTKYCMSLYNQTASDNDDIVPLLKDYGGAEFWTMTSLPCTKREDCLCGYIITVMNTIKLSKTLCFIKRPFMCELRTV
ncbi:hypothetical protein CHUAL_004466 [Chamberlinius hualienensis]